MIRAAVGIALILGTWGLALEAQRRVHAGRYEVICLMEYLRGARP